MDHKWDYGARKVALQCFLAIGATGKKWREKMVAKHISISVAPRWLGKVAVKHGTVFDASE